MHGVRALPEIVGRQRQHAERAADPVIGEAVAEEGAVPAIVLDHEQPHQESGGRNGEQQRYPPEAKVIGRPHQRPQRRQRGEGDAEFNEAARGARLAIAQQNLRPTARVICPGRVGRTLSMVQVVIPCVCAPPPPDQPQGPSHASTFLIGGIDCWQPSKVFSCRLPGIVVFGCGSSPAGLQEENYDTDRRHHCPGQHGRRSGNPPHRASGDGAHLAQRAQRGERQTRARGRHEGRERSGTRGSGFLFVDRAAGRGAGACRAP